VDADRILVLDSGKVLEHGNHNQLLEKQGVYANMWTLQQKEQKKLAESAEEGK
jgi:ATP-binding cassette subfamily B protein